MMRTMFQRNPEPSTPMTTRRPLLATLQPKMVRMLVPRPWAGRAKLANQIIEPMKNLELEISRRLQIMIGKDNIRSAQEDEMPAAWRKYIEDYYKRLGSQKQPQ